MVVGVPTAPVVEFLPSQKEGVMNVDMPKRYVKIEDAATYLGLSKKTIYRLVDSRSIPFTKPGGLDMLRFDLRALDKWMEKQLIPAKPA